MLMPVWEEIKCSIEGAFSLKKFAILSLYNIQSSSLGPNYKVRQHILFLKKLHLERLRIFEISSLLYKKGPPDWQDLVNSRFQICMRYTVVRCVSYLRS
jgi:hypothetical protein